MNKTVLLLGKGELAIRIAMWFQRSADYQLSMVVPVIPEPGWTDSIIHWCQAQGVPYVQTGLCQDIPGVDKVDWSVDLAISVFYGRILPTWFIRKPNRILNLHNSPLPRYRGLDPINWALHNLETTHGVTMHEMTPCIDAGPIVSQIQYSIYPEIDEVIDVYGRALEYGYSLFTQTMPILDRIKPTPQNEIHATYYSKHDKARLGDRTDFTRTLSVSSGSGSGVDVSSTAAPAAPGMATTTPTRPDDPSDSPGRPADSRVVDDRVHSIHTEGC